jgi:hypothetical protein
VPVHKVLQSSEYLPFAETIVGKPSIVRDDSLLGDDMQEKVQEVWNGYWAAAAGSKAPPR